MENFVVSNVLAVLPKQANYYEANLLEDEEKRYEPPNQNVV